MDWINSGIIQHLGLTLVHFIWQGILIGALYAVVNRLLRGAAAQVRYDLAVVTLVVLTAAPVVTFFYLASASTDPATAATGGAELLALTVGTSSHETTGPSLLFWVVGAWGLGVAVLSFRLLIGWRHLSRLRRSADEAYTAHLQPVLSRISRQLRIARRVRLAASTRINSPVVVGWIKPLILLPPAVVTGLPTHQLEMVLAHELAHIRRLDHFVNLFQTVVETLLFYHPAVLWVSRRIRVERENACDDLAVAVTDNRLAYIEMLATLERLRRPAPRLVLAIHDGQILSRIRRLVERGRFDRQHGLTVPGLLLAALLASAVGIGFLPESSDHGDPDEPRSEPAKLTAPETGRSMEPASAPEDPAAETVPVTTIGRPQAQSSPSGPPARETAPEQTAPDPVSQPLVDTSTTTTATDTGPLEETVDPKVPEDASVLEAETANASPEDVVDTTQALTDEAIGPGLETDSPAIDTALAPETADDNEPASDRRMAMTTIPETPRPERREEPSQATEPDPPQFTGGDIIRRIEPDYPIRARQRRADGLVEVEFQVNTDGSVSRVDVLDEQPRGLGFASAAAEAVEQWQFEPYRKGGKPISRPVRIEIGFNLESDRKCRQPTGTRVPRC